VVDACGGDECEGDRGAAAVFVVVVVLGLENDPSADRGGPPQGLNRTI